MKLGARSSSSSSWRRSCSSSSSNMMGTVVVTSMTMMLLGTSLTVVESFQASSSYPRRLSKVQSADTLDVVLRRSRGSETTTTIAEPYPPVTSSLIHRHSRMPLFSSTRESTTTETTTKATTDSSQEEEEALSDVDTRVLQAMLQDSKLDLQSEDSVRKLLERGTKAKQPTSQTTEESEPSVFSSKLFQKIGDTKLWKKLSAQTADTFESIGIWVGNKVEQDLKTLLALGLFGWERAVRDVARALPETRTVAKKTVMLLTNTSSWTDTDTIKSLGPAGSSTDNNLAEQLNRPSDEIKTVSREILGILSGQQRTSSGRGLRTAAPSGVQNTAERQRRAYRQKRRLDRRNQDLTRVGGNLADQAWELRRELAAETNQPGYKTEPIRNAIEAGVANTGNLLSQVKNKARLSAAQRKEARQLQQARDDMPSFATMSELVAALSQERQRVAANLQAGIEDPSVSWLSVDVIDSSGDDTIFDEEHLRAVVEKMVILRGEIRNQELALTNDPSATTLLQDLLDIKDGINDICQQASKNLSAVVSIRLREQLFGTEKPTATAQQPPPPPPLIMLLDADIDPSQLLQDPSAAATATATASAAVEDEVVSMERDEPFFVSTTPAEVTTDLSGADAASVTTSPADVVEDELPIMDVMADAVVIEPDVVISTATSSASTQPQDAPFSAASSSFVTNAATVITTNGDTDNVMNGVQTAAENVVVDDSMAGYRGVVAEVISDDDFETVFAEKDVAVAEQVAEGEVDEANQKPNPAAQALLRSLDIAVFVVEKVFVAGVPQTLTVADTAVKRLNEVNRNGQGSSGWTQIKGLSDSKGRY